MSLYVLYVCPKLFVSPTDPCPSIVLSKVAEKSVRVIILKKLYTFKLGDQIDDGDEEEDGGSEGEDEDVSSRSISHATEGGCGWDSH